MKTILLLRHAKSEDPGLIQPDFKRHLKERGIKDIIKVTEHFIDFGIMPEKILCSTANRTKETLHEFLQISKSPADVQLMDELYHASASTIFDCVAPEFEKHETIMVVGHNFGISQLADFLSETGCQELPTSGLVILDFDSLFEPGQGKIRHFISPKTL